MRTTDLKDGWSQFNAVLQKVEGNKSNYQNWQKKPYRLNDTRESNIHEVYKLKSLTPRI